VCALVAAADELEDVLGVADLDGVRAEAVVLAGGLALLAGALAGAAVAGLDLGVVGVGAEGELEAVLVEILAGGAVEAGTDELPLVRDVADLDAGVGGGAPVGAEGAGLAALLRGSSNGRGGEDKGGSDELHFELWLLGGLGRLWDVVE
jgi:hypothetical protein